MKILIKALTSPWRGLKAFVRYIRGLISDKEIRKKILFTFFILAIYRVFAAVPLPGVNMTAFDALIGSAPTSQASLLLSGFTGGALESPSIVGLGIGVYITASIIIQLLSSVVPHLEELTKEGQTGRKKIDQYTRFLTLPLAFAYSIGYLLLLSEQAVTQVNGNIERLIPVDTSGSVSPTNILFMSLVLTAGAMITMWLAELITEKGVGNGASIMITVSILSTLPATLATDIERVLTLQGRQQLEALFPLVVILLGFVLVYAAVVFVNESTRKLPIQYARRQRTGFVAESHLPLKLNQTGVMPIIFASALMTFPQVVLPLLVRFIDPSSPIGQFINNIYEPVQNQTYTLTAGYNIVFFLLIVVFTLFYIFIAFKPEQVAENLQKSGAFISKPAVRPGKATEDYIVKVLLRLSTAGALFLGTIALLPVLAGQIVFNVTGNNYLLLSAVGGTSILIIVSVALESLRQIEGLRTNLNYEKYA